MLCEHKWISVLAGKARNIIATPLNVCSDCGALKVGDKIISPGLEIKEIPPGETPPGETPLEETPPGEPS